MTTVDQPSEFVVPFMTPRVATSAPIASPPSPPSRARGVPTSGSRAQVDAQTELHQGDTKEPAHQERRWSSSMHRTPRARPRAPPGIQTEGEPQQAGDEEASGSHMVLLGCEDGECDNPRAAPSCDRGPTQAPPLRLLVHARVRTVQGTMSARWPLRLAGAAPRRRPRARTPDQPALEPAPEPGLGIPCRDRHPRAPAGILGIHLNVVTIRNPDASLAQPPPGLRFVTWAWRCPTSPKIRIWELMRAPPRRRPPPPRDSGSTWAAGSLGDRDWVPARTPYTIGGSAAIPAAEVA